MRDYYDKHMLVIKELMIHIGVILMTFADVALIRQLVDNGVIMVSRWFDNNFSVHVTHGI